jgi:malonyl-CoA O-methyltransferase
MIMLQDEFKGNVARSFGRAAQTYDGVAELQRKIGRALMGRLTPLSSDAVVLDLGAGTGFFARQLAAMSDGGRVIALDIAEPMLRQAKSGFEGFTVVGDAEAMPIRTGSVDLVFSNMCIQWCQSPERLFAELRRILKPHGTVVFSTFGPRTLDELRRAWAAGDDYDHVIGFRSAAEIERALVSAGLIWSEKAFWLECCPYPDVLALMRELKELGARNASGNRLRTMTGKGRLAAMIAAYPRNDKALEGGGIVATFEVLGGQLRCSGVGFE